MKYKRHVFSSSAALHMFLLECMQERESGKGSLPIVIDIMEPSGDPHDILGAYDLLSFHSDLQPTVRIMAAAGLINLAVMAAVPASHRFIAKSSMIFSYDITQFGCGTYQDLKIAAAATEALSDRIFAAITSEFGFSKEELADLCRDRQFLKSAEIVKRGAVQLGLSGIAVQGAPSDAPDPVFGPANPGFGPDGEWGECDEWGDEAAASQAYLDKKAQGEV